MPSRFEAEAAALHGICASGGRCVGPLWLAAPALNSMAAAKPIGETAQQTQLFNAALEQARSQLNALRQRGHGAQARAILDIQLAVLDDPEVLAATHAHLADGHPAVTAWQSVLDKEIAAIADHGADLADLRDRVVAILAGCEIGAVPPGVIYCGDDIAPSLFLAHDWTGGGIALTRGSALSHVALLARERGVPMLTGIGMSAYNLLKDAVGRPAALDADKGFITLNVREAVADAPPKLADLPPAAEIATHIPVSVSLNLSSLLPADLAQIAHADGVGLLRTEFLFPDGAADEETQFRAFARLVSAAGGKPVVIRSADHGGDKPLGAAASSERNPFLGLRGIRHSLAQPEPFRQQLRAVLRAAALGDVSLLLPMVSVPQELAAAHEMLAAEAADLARNGIGHKVPRLGIMMEVPSVALAPQRYARADFFAIGTNDLAQYVLAASRASPDVSHLLSPVDPSLLHLVGSAVAACKALGKPVSLCGDAAADPAALPHYLALGLRALSVPPRALEATHGHVLEWWQSNEAVR